MISLELRSRMRRLFYAEHWKIGTIAAELGVHHDTVEHAVEPDRFVNRNKPAPSQLDPYKPFVLETLEKYPKLRATRLFEMIKSRGYEGSVVQVRRYVKKVRPIWRGEAFFRLDTLPGEQGQVDWACFGTIRIGNATRRLSCFVMVLSWSRAIYARFALDQTMEQFLVGHVEAFELFEGVPRALLYDNLKSVVLERQGDHIRFHPRILELAGHYHFAPRACAPGRGNEKGHVERAIQYLRHSFFAARTFTSLDDLNAQLHEWLRSIADARFVPDDPTRRIVRDALDEERKLLLPLPQHPFDTNLVRPIASGKTPYIRFDLNDYSIPPELVRKPLTLVASEKLVRILDEQKEVARHERSYDCKRRIEDPVHLKTLAEQKRHAHELRGRDRLRQSCPHANAFLEALAKRSGRLSSTTSQLLRLLDRFGALALDAAIAEALARGAVSAQSVAHVLDQARRKAGVPPPLEVILPDDPKVRNLRVAPHSLVPYDALASNSHKEDSDDE